jgi:glutaredoxin 3
MERVVVYTTSFCPYCVAAKRLLGELEIVFEEIDVGGDPALRAEMSDRAEGRYTVPQVFIDGRPVGGYDELQALADVGGLDGLRPETGA